MTDSPLVLPPPPLYLVGIEDKFFRPRTRGTGKTRRFEPERLVECLRDYGIDARPTLAQVEAERIRRGTRRGAIDWTGSLAARRVVLPMPTHAPRSTGRAARQRIASALGPTSPQGLDEISHQYLRRSSRWRGDDAA